MFPNWKRDTEAASFKLTQFVSFTAATVCSKFVSLNAATGCDPATQQKYAAEPQFQLENQLSCFFPQRPLSILHLCSGFFLQLLDGRTREQREKRSSIPARGLPPLPLTSSNQQKPLSLYCHRGAAVGATYGSLYGSNRHPLTTPQAPQTRRPNFTLL